MDLFSRTNLLVFTLAVVSFFLLVSGVRALRLGSRTIYFRHRRQRVLAGWWMTGAGLLLAVIALMIFRALDLSLAPAAPTSVPVTKAASATPSRTSTPAPRSSREVTFTASPTSTPHLPLSLEIMVVSSVTPQVSATIRNIRFAEALDEGFPIGDHSEFSNPVARMHATFFYSHMTYGAQFIALWFRNGELVYYDSRPWKLGGRGLTHSLWEPAYREWHPGEYEVQFYVGTTWKATGRFTVTGDPPTPTFTPTSTVTRTPSLTWTPRPLPSETPIPTSTK